MKHSDSSEFKLGAMILAAGQSSRMGKPKMLLPWGKTSILGHLIGNCQSLRIDQLAVVMFERDEAVKEELDRIHFPTSNRILNPEATSEMYYSVLCGFRWSGWERGITHYAVILGDQPQIKLETIGALVQFARKHPAAICQPCLGGKRLHPVIIPRPAAAKIAAANYRHLKEALNRHENGILALQVDDGGANFDIDSPSDYLSLHRRFSGHER